MGHTAVGYCHKDTRASRDEQLAYFQLEEQWEQIQRETSFKR